MPFKSSGVGPLQANEFRKNSNARNIYSNPRLEALYDPIMKTMNSPCSPMSTVAINFDQFKKPKESFYNHY